MYIQRTINLNNVLYIGIDAHPSNHAALAINRFEEEQGHFEFENSHEEIEKFIAWLGTFKKRRQYIFIGIEGGGNARHALLAALLFNKYENVFEVNPQYTKQHRDYGTRNHKSDIFDAKLIAEIVARKHPELPRIKHHELTDWLLSLRKYVWFYEELAVEGARYKNQLHKANRELILSKSDTEKIVLEVVIQHREQRIKDVKKTKQGIVNKFKELLQGNGDHLTSIPGIALTTIARIIVHANGLERFPTKYKFIRYAGISPKERSSGKKKNFKKDNRGKRSLNSVFYMAAVGQIKHNPKSKAYYEKKIAEGKTKSQALVCVMRMLASMVYTMMKTGQDYRG